MDTREILNLVRNRLTYKQGWSFDAWPRASYRANEPEVVEVNWEARVPNSSPRHIDPRPEVITRGSFTIFPSSEEMVLTQIMAGIQEGEEHEMREFMRIDGYAPFHPHHTDGDNRWANRR